MIGISRTHWVFLFFFFTFLKFNFPSFLALVLVNTVQAYCWWVKESNKNRCHTSIAHLSRSVRFSCLYRTKNHSDFSYFGYLAIKNRIFSRTRNNHFDCKKKCFSSSLKFIDNFFCAHRVRDFVMSHVFMIAIDEFESWNIINYNHLFFVCNIDDAIDGAMKKKIHLKMHVLSEIISKHHIFSFDSIR